MKKIISALLSLTMAATMATTLTSCGSKQEESSDTLVWYTFGDTPKDLALVLEEANKIIEPELGVKLDMRFIDSASYEEKMKLKMASGEAYDLAFTGYINSYQTAVELGGLYDITDIIDEVGLKEVIPQFYLDAATINGKIYGIPNIQVVSNPVCIEMDKTLTNEIDANLPAIQEAACNARSYEDLVSYSKLLDDLFEKVHKARPDLYVYNPTYNLIMEPMYEGILGDVGINRYSDPDKIEAFIVSDSDMWKLATQKLREWYQKGYIRSDIASKGAALSGVEEERQIAVRGTTWKPGQDPFYKEKYGDDPDYAFLYEPFVGRTSALATMTSVGANSKNPKKAVEFIKLINSNKDLYNLICWGIEGKHYTKDENGIVTEIKDSGYDGNGSSAWKYGNQFNGFLSEGQEPGVWEETEKMNNEARKSVLLGFIPDPAPITNELANIANVQAEYQAKIAFGTEDLDSYYDEYRQKLEVAGVQKVKEEIQKQIDEFVASKKK